MLYRENGQFKTSYRSDQQVFPILQDRIAVAVLLTLAAVAVPWLASEYLLRAVLIPFLILALAALGLNILVGYCGQISLGTGGFMAVGAYAAYNLIVRVPGMPLIVALLLGGVFATLVGVLFGIPSLRIRGLFLAVFAVFAKNIVRGHIGREWMAIRDMDVAAEVIGIRPVYAKLTAFAVSSFIVGVAGALWGFVHLGSWEPAAFNIDRSFQLLFMIIIGGLGSIMGSFFGAAFIVVLPIILDNLPLWFDVPIDTALASHLTFMIFGSLIVFFLIVEPHGLARLWSIGKEKLRLWPFPH
jgi:branched-chain amino acid transport system permease protein